MCAAARDVGPGGAAAVPQHAVRGERLGAVPAGEVRAPASAPSTWSPGCCCAPGTCCPARTCASAVSPPTPANASSAASCSPRTPCACAAGRRRRHLRAAREGHARGRDRAGAGAPPAAPRGVARRPLTPLSLETAKHPLHPHLAVPTGTVHEERQAGCGLLCCPSRGTDRTVMESYPTGLKTQRLPKGVQLSIRIYSPKEPRTPHLLPMSTRGWPRRLASNRSKGPHVRRTENAPHTPPRGRGPRRGGRSVASWRGRRARRWPAR